MAPCKTQKIYPIMGPIYCKADFAALDMSEAYLKSMQIATEVDMISYHRYVRKKYDVRWLIGGYLEHRALYTSALFRDLSDPRSVRDIHLGVDIWGTVGSLIYAPIDGTIHSFAYNSDELDYGYTLILKHIFNGEQLHTLYGHLSKNHYNQWEVGKEIKAGDIIGDFGNKEENGGWLPHLHFQLIKDMDGLTGDYPGVCSISRLDYYKENCPDPDVLTKKAP